MIRAAGILFIAKVDDQDAGLFLLRGPGGDFPNHFGIPGGKEEDEDKGDMLECALRECREEIGALPAGEPKLLMTQHLVHQANEDYPTDDVCFTTFTQRVAAQFTPKLCDEHTGFAWVALKDVMNEALPNAQPSVV